MRSRSSLIVSMSGWMSRRSGIFANRGSEKRAKVAMITNFFKGTSFLEVNYNNRNKKHTLVIVLGVGRKLQLNDFFIHKNVEDVDWSDIIREWFLPRFYAILMSRKSFKAKA